MGPGTVRQATMISMRALSSVFIDTGAFLALVDPKDTYFEAASEFYRGLGAAVRQYTSWAVVAETYTWLRYHLDATKAAQWLGRFEDAEKSALIQVIYPERDLDLRTRRLLYQFHDQALSYADAFTLSVLESRPDIEAVFAFDHHMALAGVTILPGPVA